jgi:hypothetical protein
MTVLVLLIIRMNRPYRRNISHCNPTHFVRYTKIYPGDILWEHRKSICSNLTDESYVVDKCLEGQGKFSIAGQHFPDAGTQTREVSVYMYLARPRKDRLENTWEVYFGLYVSNNSIPAYCQVHSSLKHTTVLSSIDRIGLSKYPC